MTQYSTLRSGEAITSSTAASQEIEEYYREKLARFREAIDRAMEVSIGAGGVQSDHGRQYWSSVLFTKMLVTCMSIARLCPGRNGRNDRYDLWDLSSVASLVRDITECHLSFFYLCVDEVKSEEEWQVRQNLLFVQDNRARHRMITDFDQDPDEATYQQRQSELRVRLEGFPSFMALPEKRRRELLKGDKAPYIQDELLERMGFERSFFRGYYRFLSAHVHTGPISFFRMSEHGRGNGVENDYDKNGIAVALEFATRILQEATAQMVALHPSAEQRGKTVLIGNRRQRRAQEKRQKR